MRLNDEEIRKIALECLHLFAGVNEDFNLHLVFAKVMKKLFVCELLKEYEIWEYSKDLIKISRDIRTTIKEKIKNSRDEEKKKENEETKEEEDGNENGMKVEPIAQEFHSVQTKQKK